MDSQAILPSEYLRTPEAANYLSLSPQFLEVCRHRGEGPPYVKIGRAIRYRRSALDDWMTARESGPRPAGAFTAENSSRREKSHVEMSR